jgi:hypothetical protein
VSAMGSQPLEKRVTHLQDCHPPKTASWLRRLLGMQDFYRRVCPTRLPPRHHCTTFSPAPESRDPAPSLERRNSSGPSKSAR